MKKIFLIGSFALSTIVLGACLISSQSKNGPVAAQAKPVENTPGVMAKQIEKIEGFEVFRIDGSIIAPENLDEMVKTSDLIVVGKPLQTVAESTPLVKTDSEGYIYEAISQTQFRVSQVFKGTLSSKVISIGQQAAIVRDKGYSSYAMRVFDSYQPLVKDAKYILFLKKGLNGSPLYFSAGVYYGTINTDGKDEGEKKMTISQDLKEVREAVFRRYNGQIKQDE
jgi:hypothetical protein